MAIEISYIYKLYCVKSTKRHEALKEENMSLSMYIPEISYITHVM